MQPPTPIYEDLLSIIALLRDLNTSIERGKLESTLSESERQQIINKIAQTVEDQLNSKLLSNIEMTYGRHIRNEKISEMAVSSSRNTIKRLAQNVLDLQRKANVNLLYGSGCAIFGIAVLTFLIYTAKIPEGVRSARDDCASVAWRAPSAPRVARSARPACR